MSSGSGVWALGRGGPNWWGGGGGGGAAAGGGALRPRPCAGESEIEISRIRYVVGDGVKLNFAIYFSLTRSRD